MPARVRRLLKAVLLILIVILVAGIAAAAWVRGELRASLPELDGSQQLRGLSAAVEIKRDRLGIPSIRGATREDVARALGFLHAQDRFFQMDLSRRRAAGDLSALVGARALALDREIRVHRFRAEAHRALDLMDPSERRVLEAYTAGVNSGLSTLGARPFEYIVLRQQPQPWGPEDSFLVVLSMFITLQDTDGSYESTLGTMHDVLPEAMFEFLAPRGTEWDTPVIGDAFSTPRFRDRTCTTFAHDARAKRHFHCPNAHRGSNSQFPSPNFQARLWRSLEIGIRILGFGIWDLPSAKRSAATTGLSLAR